MREAQLPTLVGILVAMEVKNGLYLVILIFFPNVVHTREGNNKTIMEGKNHLACDVQAGILSGQCVY